MAANQDLDRVFKACRKGAKPEPFREAATGKQQQGSSNREAAHGKIVVLGRAARTEITGTNAFGINVTECLSRLCRMGITF